MTLTLKDYERLTKSGVVTVEKIEYVESKCVIGVDYDSDMVKEGFFMNLKDIEDTIVRWSHIQYNSKTQERRDKIDQIISYWKERYGKENARLAIC